MGDLISRKGVVNWLENYKFENYASVGHEKEYNFIENLIKGIQNEPTVEAKSVVHGEWERTRFAGEYICSNCQSLICSGLTRMGFEQYKFCPECGADMRGGKNE
jgi:rubrerythrin